ncbi:MAG TPA: site-2 protease family protein [Gaiellales bacterium]|nr:site-2 protease family protein [Gaiellales bacterium]
MRQVIPFGRVAGIPIGASWTWLPVVALVIVNYSGDVFPASNPGLSSGTYMAMAIALTGLFFAGLILHELGHAFIARRNGMEIQGITLWLFGGVARITGEFEGPGVEFRVALAGPVVTCVLGFGFAAASLLLDLPSAVDGVVSMVAVANLFLLAFNLIPAYPLDGGRILHAVLWRFQRDRSAATRVSAGIGRGFGIVLVGVGIAGVLAAQDPRWGWLSVMGVFLLMAATGERRTEQVRSLLDGLTVADVIERDPVCVLPSLSLAEFVNAVVWAQRYTTYPVFDGERVVGMLPFRSVAAVPRSNWDVTRVADVMTPLSGIVLLDEAQSLTDAAGRLSADPLQRGLVLDGERLVGLVSISDIARAFERRARAV